MGFGIHTGAVANPHGRPRKGTRITDHILDLLAQSEHNFYELKDFLEKRQKTKRLGKITVGRLLAARLIVKGLEGDVEAMREILNRVEGKVENMGALAPLPVINIQTNVLVAGVEEDKMLSEGAKTSMPE